MNPNGSRPMKSGGGMRGDVIPKGYKAGQLQQYTPEQMQLLNQRIGDVGPDSYLSKLAGGDQGLFDEMEAPAFQQFQEALGGLASRFSQGSGRGSLGNRKSSGFQNTGTAAMSNFAQQLQAQRQSLQRQAIMDLQGISSTLLDKRPYERFMEKKPEKESSGWGSLIGGVAGGIGGAFVGQPVLGAQAGAAVGGYF